MKVTIIGQGNVATHLHRGLSGAGVVATVANSHTLQGISPDSDVVILAVSDDAIADVASHLPRGKWILAHTSGSTDMSVLSPYSDKIGVFYPLQTFSKDVELDYAHIPFLIEGDERLADLAKLVSNDVRLVDSATRLRIHMSSVFACNFVNHLWTLAADVLEECGQDFSVLHPLIRETCRKGCSHHPASVQTGPAVRNDSRVIDRHLELLESNADLREIYKLLTHSIKSHD